MDTKLLEIAHAELKFEPKEEQLRIRSAFWARYNENPLCPIEDLSLGAIEQLMPDPRLQKWWQSAGFRMWFLNQNSYHEQALHVAEIGQNELMLVIMDPKTPPAAKVAAIRLAAELAGKLSKQKQDTNSGKFLDGDISTMDKGQAIEFIQKKLKALGIAPKE